MSKFSVGSWFVVSTVLCGVCFQFNLDVMGWTFFILAVWFILLSMIKYLDGSK